MKNLLIKSETATFHGIPYLVLAVYNYDTLKLINFKFSKMDNETKTKKKTKFFPSEFESLLFKVIQSSGFSFSSYCFNIYFQKSDLIDFTAFEIDKRSEICI